MELKDFKPGDIVVVTPECAAAMAHEDYDSSAWTHTRMRVMRADDGDIFVDVLAIDSRPDRDWLLRTRRDDLARREEDPNEIHMCWLPEQLQKVS